MSNFGVTMEQCMGMDQQDWDLRIEGVGLETAVQQWEARPKASKPIDQEWRTPVSQKQRRKADSPPAEQLDVADGEGADSDRDSADDCETDSAPEDEFAQLPESQAATDGRAAEEEEEDATPWDTDARAEAPGEGVTVHRTGAIHRNSNGRTNGTRENRGPNREEQRSGPSAGTASDSQRQVDPGAHQRTENGQSDGRTAAKRKATNINRNGKRTRRRAVKATSSSDWNQSQRALQVVVGAGVCSHAQLGVVPWEHRGMLGHTRGGGGEHSFSMRGAEDI